MKKWLIIPIVLMLAGGTAFADPQMIQIKGSDTVINLVQRLAEEYMQKNPGSYIAVTGGGSGTGVAALINDKCDIANASRTMKPKEMSQAEDNGISVGRVVIALDGLSVITHPENPVKKLTVDQIGAMYRGEVTNWSEVGGNNMPVNLYGRQSNSGTFVFFQDFVLKGEYTGKMNRMNGNAQIVEAVKSDPSGIGYVGVGYVQDQPELVVSVASRPGAEYASPLDSEQVKSGQYPIARPLNQYINGKPQGPVKEFLEFELSEMGQKIVEKEGFFPISKEYRELNAQAGI